MKSFEQAWNQIQTNLHPETKIPNWTALKKHRGNDIIIKLISKNEIHFKSPTANNMQVVPKDDFKVVWGVWEDYKNGKIIRSEVREMTRFSRYIINTFKWIDGENCSYIVNLI